MSDHLIAEANRHAKALSKMTLPTTKPNARDLDWYVRECESLDERNKMLEAENAALREELDWKTKRLKLLSDCLHKIDGFLKQAATSVFVDALDSARKEAQP